MVGVGGERWFGLFSEAKAMPFLVILWVQGARLPTCSQCWTDHQIGSVIVEFEHVSTGARVGSGEKGKFREAFLQILYTSSYMFKHLYTSLYIFKIFKTNIFWYCFPRVAVASGTYCCSNKVVVVACGVEYYVLKSPVLLERLHHFIMLHFLEPLLERIASSVWGSQILFFAVLAATRIFTRLLQQWQVEGSGT